VSSKGHKGYYFFDSKGKRLANKWWDASLLMRDWECLDAV
jgi:hypothetical protein